MSRPILVLSVFVIALLAACSDPSDAPGAVAGEDPLAAIKEEAAAREALTVANRPVEVLDPARSASVQVCVDTSAAGGAERAGRLLAAVADSLDAAVRIDEGWVSALNVEVWAAVSGEGGLLVEGSIPEIRDVQLVAGLDAAHQAALLQEQAEQRQRLEPIARKAAELSMALRDVTVPSGAGSDVLGCVSRANSRMAGRDPGRRLLVIASDLPIGHGSTHVNGSLAGTRQVLVLGWGDDVARRSELWLDTWGALGASPATNLHRYEFDDGVGQVLATAIAGLVPS